MAVAPWAPTLMPWSAKPHPGPGWGQGSSVGGPGITPFHLPRGWTSPNLTHTCESKGSRGGTPWKPGAGGGGGWGGRAGGHRPSQTAGARPARHPRPRPAPQAPPSKPAEAKDNQIQKQTQENRHK